MSKKGFAVSSIRELKLISQKLGPPAHVLVTTGPLFIFLLTTPAVVLTTYAIVGVLRLSRNRHQFFKTLAPQLESRSTIVVGGNVEIRGWII